MGVRRELMVLGLFAILLGSITAFPNAHAAFDPLITINNPNPSIQPDDFGESVSISDNFILVGSPREDTAPGNQAGIAYLFDKSGNLLQTYNNPAPAFADLFGNSVSIDGDKVIIGARGDSTVNTAAGSAYLFDTSGNLLQTYHSPSAGAVDQFGTSVSISGDKILVGSPGTLRQSEGGKAYLFDTSGNQLQVYSNPSPGSSDSFGSSVSLSGDKVVIGSPNDDLIGGFNQGSSYLFDTSGNLLQTYNNPAPSNVARFGTSVSVSGEKVLIGSPFFEGIFGPPGDAYLFDTSGNLLQTYNSPSITPDFFGGSVSLSGEKVLIGAKDGDSSVSRSGIAYLYDTSKNLLETFENPTPDIRDGFGISVSLSKLGSVGIGDPGDDETTPNGGSVFLYNFNNPPICELSSDSNEVDSFKKGMITTSSISTTIMNTDIPPFHKTAEILLSGVTDVDGDSLTLYIDDITQDEPTSGLSQGDKSPDGFGVGTETATIRVERDAQGDGRVYEILFTAEDPKGEQCSSSRLVGIPHDSNNDAIDSVQIYDSTVP
jgi:hypothetical protein